jgi:hypothetical protein
MFYAEAVEIQISRSVQKNADGINTAKCIDVQLSSPIKVYLKIEGL